MTRLSPAACSALADAAIATDRVTLAAQLDRPVYEEVAEALTRIGGRWSKRDGAHRFAFYDPRPLVAGLLATGAMPPKNPTAFFPTPPALVEEMLDEVWLSAYRETGFYDLWRDGHGREMRILEPSAGVGNIARAIRACVPQAQIDCVELLDVNAHTLRAAGFTVFEQDFLAFAPTVPYDRVVMNPPFSGPGAPLLWAAHLRHAWDLLAPGGRLAAIVPDALRAPLDLSRAADRVKQDIGHLIADHGWYADLPEGSFAPSGTQVATALVVLEKPGQPATRARHGSGFHCAQCWATCLEVVNDEAAYRARGVLFETFDRGAFAMTPVGPGAEGRAAILAGTWAFLNREDTRRLGVMRHHSAACEDDIVRDFWTDYTEHRGYAGLPPLDAAAADDPVPTPPHAPRIGDTLAPVDSLATAARLATVASPEPINIPAMVADPAPVDCLATVASSESNSGSARVTVGPTCSAARRCSGPAAQLALF